MQPYDRFVRPRQIYRGDQPLTVVIEDWMECTCGAYQNVRRLNEISVGD